MNDGDKIAAAILAAEASRQIQEMTKAIIGKTPTSRDVSGELFQMYEYMLARVKGYSDLLKG